MMKTIIYGGSFDPVHKGHEDIINKLSERFDEVIVVPAFVSPFKKGSKAAPPDLRLKMLRSIALPANAIISDYEINKGDVSYSIDTVNHFYTEGRELFFAIGSEGASTLDMWKNIDELRKKCKFYVIDRPGFTKRKSGLTYADFTGKDISSSEVKVAVAFGRASELVSEPVAKIIQSEGLYEDYKRFTVEYDTFGLKKERIEHTYRATLTGIKLAKRFRVDVNDCIIALLVHDIGKYVTKETLSGLGIKAPDCDELPVECRHAEYGAAICEQYFHLDQRIVKAVKTHTVCGTDMDRLGEIVALADYIEPGRKFAGVDRIRAAACEDLDIAMELMLKGTIDYLTEKGKFIVPITVEAYKKYEKQNRGKNDGTN